MKTVKMLPQAEVLVNKLRAKAVELGLASVNGEVQAAAIARRVKEAIGLTMTPEGVRKVFRGEREPKTGTLVALNAALGAGIFDNLAAAPMPYPVAGDSAIPILGEVAAATGELALTHYGMEDLGEVETVSDAGRVGIRLHGDSAVPLFLDGQVVLCDPDTDPDDAPPHPDVNVPVAVGIITAGPYDGLAFIKRWYHNKKSGIVTLRSINPLDVDDTGEVRKIEVPRKHINPAWAVCGQRWW